MKIITTRIFVGMMGFLVLLGLAKNWFFFGFNFSDSLSHFVFLVIKDKEVERGDYAAFWVPDNQVFPANTAFVKEVAGVAGDKVTRKDDVFFVNDREIGRFLHETETGEPLQPGPTGQLPEGSYFMAGEHERSFDSRYQYIGWVPKSNLIGRAYPLF